MASWYPRAPTLFQWDCASFMSRISFIIDMCSFLWLSAMQILWGIAWNTRNQVAWLFSWFEHRDDTFWGFIKAQSAWGRRDPAQKHCDKNCRLFFVMKTLHWEKVLAAWCCCICIYHCICIRIYHCICICIFVTVTNVWECWKAVR